VVRTAFRRDLVRLSIKPFAIREPELEVSAYNDGAFFQPHIDTMTGQPGRDSCRMVSGVYYFQGQPKGFEGGELRLHRFGSRGGDNEGHIDLAPIANSCLLFPSWAPHEVRPVRCPSGRFEDSRFAVNIWLHAAIQA
jgi:SM-20-related protein